jgi:predicted RNA-binding protein with PIN domain
MSARILLIDGYNLLHAAGMGQLDYKPGELLRSRTRLLKLLLSKLTTPELRAVTLIFDARDPPPDRPSEIKVAGMNVVFANPGGDADVMIQKWLARHPTPRRVTLVSSDRVLQRAARGCGAKFVASDAFLDELDRRRPSHGKKAAHDDDDSKPGASPSDSQTAYWLREFGDQPPVIEEVPEAPVEPAPTKSTLASTPTVRTTPEKSRRQRQSKSEEGLKPSGSIDPAELEVWLKAYGELLASESVTPEDSRRSELEAWLEQELLKPEDEPRRFRKP